MKLLLSFTLSLLLGAVASQAQNAKNKPQSQFAVSFVCVGALSNAYWSGQGKNMTVTAHDPGASPPGNLIVTTSKKSTKKSEKKEDKESIRTALNSASDYIRMTTNLCRVEDKSSSGEQTPYVSFSLPEKPGLYSVFLARKPRSSTWKDPQHLVLSDSQADFPLGSVRVVNLSDRVILIKLNGKSAKLKPGSSRTLKKVMNLENPPRIELYYLHKNKEEMAYKRNLKYSSNTRKTLTCAYTPKKSKPLSVRLVSTKTIKP